VRAQGRYIYIYIYIYVNISLTVSVVGIATGYGLDGSGIESPRPRANPASCTVGTGSFPGVKRLGRDADPSPPSSAVVKKEQSYTSTPPMDRRPVQALSACTTKHFTFLPVLL